MTNDENGKIRQRSDEYFRFSMGVIIIATIVFFVVNGPQSNASDREKSSGEPTFSGTAILGGVEHRSHSSAFRSAEATAFMGGIKLDFREATMAGNEATIDVTALMGGAEIFVPRDWTVVNRVTSVMGAVKDHTQSSGDSKRVVIEGTALMGGVTIRN